MKDYILRGKVKRAEPESEPFSSPVLRSNELSSGDAVCGGWRGAQRRPPITPGLSKKHISSPFNERRASFEFYRGANFLKVKIEREPCNPHPPKRREVTGFSTSARRRMLDLLAKIENGEVPIFATLTYPDSFPIYHETFKNHLDLLGQRLLRRWPKAFLIWKLEFKVRKSGDNIGKVAPHYHLFIYGVPWEFKFKQEIGKFYSLKRCVASDGSEYYREIAMTKDGEQFVTACWTDYDRPQGKIESGFDSLRRWMTRNWYDIVGSNDYKHHLAGTRVELLHSVKGAFYYASKRYMGKMEDELQLKNKPGRFWGVIGRANLKLGKYEELTISAKQAFVIRRTFERYRRANTKPERRKFLKRDFFSAKLYCNADFWIHRLLKLIGPPLKHLPKPLKLLFKRNNVFKRI